MGKISFAKQRGKYFIGSCARSKIPKGIIEFYKSENKYIFQTRVQQQNKEGAIAENQYIFQAAVLSIGENNYFPKKQEAKLIYQGSEH